MSAGPSRKRSPLVRRGTSHDEDDTHANPRRSAGKGRTQVGRPSLLRSSSIPQLPPIATAQPMARQDYSDAMRIMAKARMPKPATPQAVRIFGKPESETERDRRERKEEHEFARHDYYRPPPIRPPNVPDHIYATRSLPDLLASKQQSNQLPLPPVAPQRLQPLVKRRGSHSSLAGEEKAKKAKKSAPPGPKQQSKRNVLEPWEMENYPEPCVGQDAIDVVLRWRKELGWSCTGDRNATCDSGKTLLPQLQLVLDAKKLGKAAGKAAGGKPPSGPGAKFVNEDHPLALAFLRCTIDPRNANMYALVVSTMEALKSLPVHYTVSTSCVVRRERGKDPALTPLLRFAWERDIALRLYRIPYFRNYQLRRAFVLWRRNVAICKQTRLRSNVESSCVLAKRAQRVTILRIYSLCEAVCPAQDQFLSPDKTDWLSMSLREIWEEMERSYLQSCQLAPRLCNMQDFHRFGHVDLPTEGLDTLPALPVLEYTTSISQQLMAVNKSVSETWDASLKSLREACANITTDKGFPDFVPEADQDAIPDFREKMSNLTVDPHAKYVRLIQFKEVVIELALFAKVADIVLQTMLRKLALRLLESFLHNILRSMFYDCPSPVPETQQLGPESHPPVSTSSSANDDRRPLWMVDVVVAMGNSNSPDDKEVENALDVCLSPEGNIIDEQITEIIQTNVTTCSSFRRLNTVEELSPYIVVPDGLPLLHPSALPSEESPLLLTEAQIEESEQFPVLLQLIHDSVNQALDSASEVLPDYKRYVEIIKYCQSVDRDVRKLTAREADAFREYLTKFSQQLSDIRSIDQYRRVGAVLLNFEPLRNTVIPHPRGHLEHLFTVLPKLALEERDQISESISDGQRVLQSEPQKIDEVLAMKAAVDRLLQELPALQAQAESLDRLFEVVSDFDVPVTPVDVASFKSLRTTFRDYQTDLIQHRKLKSTVVDTFSQDLDKQMQSAKDDLCNLVQWTQLSQWLSMDTVVSDAVAAFAKRDQEIQQIASRLVDFGRYLSELRSAMASAGTKRSREQQDSKDSKDSKESLLQELHTLMQHAQQQFLYRRQLWNSCSRIEAIESKGASVLTESEVNELHLEVTGLAQTTGNLQKGLPTCSAVTWLKSKVTELKALLPLLTHLHNTHMHERHWRVIRKDCPPLRSLGQLSLAMLRKSEVMEFQNAIAEISLQASQEASVEMMMNKIKEDISSLKFSIAPFAKASKGDAFDDDVLVVAETETLLSQLEDTAVSLQSLVTSKYADHIRLELLEHLEEFNTTTHCVDQWLACQRNWQFLANVFSTIDIQRQLHMEYIQFSQVDRQWQTLMRKANEDPHIVLNTSAAGVIDVLEMANATLDQVYRSLADYLETKRMEFPRFFFLSDEELISILANVQKPQVVESQLSKCFGNTNHFQWSESEGGFLSVTGLVSHEGEILTLCTPVQARGAVDHWMNRLVKVMANSVTLSIQDAINTFHMALTVDCLQKSISQALVIASQVSWSSSISHSLGPEHLAQLREIQQAWRERLDQLSQLVFSTLPTHQHNTLTSLITLEVHARDVIRALVSEGSGLEQSFTWLRQLRYSYERDPHEVLLNLEQWRTVIKYDMEFMGARQALVITPLTDRCYLTLMTAMEMNLGGAPAGPAGTGKTETVKELAKAAGKFCVVFNCSDALNFKMLGAWFSGMVQTGAWCCMDEFNRIDIEVLSVVSQLLESIHSAKNAFSERFVCAGREVTLIRTCGFFVTNNPGYAGRVELPNNLKQHFRPIAMTVPDAQVITEVVLFSYGFSCAPTLAKKVAMLYNFARTSFSDAYHYDWGLRAIKTMLVVAGQKKQTLVEQHGPLNFLSSETVESVLIVEALDETNRSKLLSCDTVAFDSLVESLFPAVDIPQMEDKLLEAGVCHAVNALELTPDQRQMLKIHQLHSIMRVRHGLMLIGPTSVGKTTLLKVLAEALNSILVDRMKRVEETVAKYKAKHRTNRLQFSSAFDRASEFTLPADIRRFKAAYRGVEVATIHPKCLSLGELYGSSDRAGAQYQDGLLSRVIRRFAGQLGLVAKAFRRLGKRQHAYGGSNVQDTMGSRHGGMLKQTKPLLLTDNEDQEEEESLSTFPAEVLFPYDNDVAPYGWRWTVLDGPVDSSWIENLNTALDETKTLSLANGERINLVPGMRLIFEVDSLEDASPATISRCGMINIDNSDLNWRVLVRKWLKTVPVEVGAPQLLQLKNLFEHTIDAGLKLVERHRNKLTFPPSGHGLIQTLTSILSGFFDYIAAHGGFSRSTDSDDSQSMKGAKAVRILTVFRRQQSAAEMTLAKIFVQAYLWSFGAPFQQDAGVDDSLDGGTGGLDLPTVFDNHVRVALGGGSSFGLHLPQPPKLLMDYVIDLDTGHFVQWESRLPKLHTTASGSGGGVAKATPFDWFFDNPNTDSGFSKSDMLTATPQAVQSALMLAMLLQQNRSILLAGNPGCGKSAFMKRCLRHFSQIRCGVEGHQHLMRCVFSHGSSGVAQVILSSQDTSNKPAVLEVPTSSWTSSVSTCMSGTTSHDIKKHWMSQVQKKHKSIYWPLEGRKKLLLGLDDIHIPQSSGSCAPSEVIRQFLDTGTIYSQHGNWLIIDGAAVVATCQDASKLPSRLLHHFSLLRLKEMNSAQLNALHVCLLETEWRQRGFSHEALSLLPRLVKAIVGMCRGVLAKLRPTPSRPHYIFDVRDIGKAINALQSAPPQLLKDNGTLHSFLSFSLRCVFRDRISDRKDLETFKCIHDDVMRVDLQMGGDARRAEFHNETIFTDLIDIAVPPQARTIAAANDALKLTSTLRQYQENFTCDDKQHEPLNMVFFDMVIWHIVRLARVLHQPGGHVVMVGLVGTGRRSVAKLATFIEQLDWKEITHGNVHSTFVSLYREAMQQAAVKSQGTAIYISGSQLKESGDLDAIVAAMQNNWLPSEIDESEVLRLLSTFRQRNALVTGGFGQSSGETPKETLSKYVHQYIHIIVSLSPASPLFRQICLLHPKLFTSAQCVDAFKRWDETALFRVATVTFRNLNVPAEEEEQKIKDLHEKAVRSSVKIYQEACKVQEDVESGGGQMMYLTPNIFIHFLNTFLALFNEKTTSLLARRDRLKTGADVLAATKQHVEDLKRELALLTPQLASKVEDAQNLLDRLETDKSKAMKDEEHLAAVEEDLRQEESNLQKKVDLASQELGIAMPALESARQALKALKKADISEIRMYTNPPAGVKVILAAVCELLKVKPTWESAKFILTDSGFRTMLVEFDCDAVSDGMLAKIAPYTKDANFNPSRAAKVSVALTSLCNWVLAVQMYAKAKRLVDPRMAELSEAKAILNDSQVQLQAKQTEHQAIVSQLTELESQHASTNEECDQLKQDVAKATERFSRAKYILECLQDETGRWDAAANEASASLQYAVGDYLLVAAGLVYSGVLNANYRSLLFKQWVKVCTVPVKSDFDFTKLLESLNTTHQWIANGLPFDKHTIQSAAIFSNCRRCPLIIDPQHQARKWIVATHRPLLDVIDWQSSSAHVNLQHSMRLGRIALLENVPAMLDATLRAAVVCAAKARQCNEIVSMSEGSFTMNCQPRFRLFLVSADAQPDFLPDAFCFVTVINFAVNIEALKDQLLTDTLDVTIPDLNNKRLALIRDISKGQEQLEEVENTMLSVLQKQKSSLLDDMAAVDQLLLCKERVKTIKKQMVMAERLQGEVQTTREVFEPVAVRGGALFLALQDILPLSPMYHFSSQWFHRVFAAALADVQSTSLDTNPEKGRLKLRKLVASFVERVTHMVFASVLCALKEHHKPVFALLAAIHVMIQVTPDQQSTAHLWRAFIQAPMHGKSTSGNEEINLPGHASLVDIFSDAVQGHSSVSSQLSWLVDTGITKPAYPWLTDNQWRQIVYLDTAVKKTFKGICLHMMTHRKFWTRWQASNIDDIDWTLSRDDALEKRSSSVRLGELATFVPSALPPLGRLVLVRILRPTSLLHFADGIYPSVLGMDDLPAPLSPRGVLHMFDNSVPVVLVLSQESMPLKLLNELAKEQTEPVTIVTKSLGRGQGKEAEEIVFQATLEGHWVLLQNCHLAKSWMASLESFVAERITNNRCLPKGFRLWLSTEDVAAVPLSILQNAPKISLDQSSDIGTNFNSLLTTERRNLVRQGDFETTLDEIGVPWKQLVFNMCLLHSVLQARCGRHRQMSFNASYHFTEGDLAAACQCIAEIFISHATTPWDHVKTMIEGTYYGGRITDTMDRLTFNALLQRFLSPQVLNKDWNIAGVSLHVKDSATTQRCVRLIRKLNAAQAAEVIGLPPNSSERLVVSDCNTFLKDLKLLHPHFLVSTATKATQSELERYLLKMTATITSLLPPQVFLGTPKNKPSLMEDFICFEVRQYNDLLSRIAQDLASLQETLQANQSSNMYLEQMSKDLLAGQVPGCWKAISYPSTLRLGAWLHDLNLRMDFIRSWVKCHGIPLQAETSLASGRKLNLSVGQSQGTVKKHAFVVWLGGMFRPRGFLTTLLIEHAEEHHLAIDDLKLKCWIAGVLESSTLRPSADYSDIECNDVNVAATVRGMAMVGAAWDVDRCCLCELPAGTRIQRLANVILTIEKIPVSAGVEAASSTTHAVSCERNASSLSPDDVERQTDRLKQMYACHERRRMWVNRPQAKTRPVSYRFQDSTHSPMSPTSRRDVRKPLSAAAGLNRGSNTRESAGSTSDKSLIQPSIAARSRGSQKPSNIAKEHGGSAVPEQQPLVSLQNQETFVEPVGKEKNEDDVFQDSESCSLAHTSKSAHDLESSSQPQQDSYYRCPVYSCLSHGSAVGANNFIDSLELASGGKSDLWKLHSVSLVCQVPVSVSNA